jgi:hypothetical protein
MKRKDMLRDDGDNEHCNQHPETCSNPYCRAHN